MNMPGINIQSLKISEELDLFIQQYYKVTKYVEEAQLAGRVDEARLLESNLTELVNIINTTHSNK